MLKSTVLLPGVFPHSMRVDAKTAVCLPGAPSLSINPYQRIGIPSINLFLTASIHPMNHFLTDKDLPINLFPLASDLSTAVQVLRPPLIMRAPAVNRGRGMAYEMALQPLVYSVWHVAFSTGGEDATKTNSLR